jgi:hypothetical protein
MKNMGENDKKKWCQNWMKNKEKMGYTFCAFDFYSPSFNASLRGEGVMLCRAGWRHLREIDVRWIGCTGIGGD